jgi:hypothetical protein
MNAKAPTFLSVLGFFMQLKKHMLSKRQNIRQIQQTNIEFSCISQPLDTTLRTFI